MTSLKERNPLPIDRDILYDDETHTYGLRSKPFKRFISVTAVAADRLPPFNATVISAKLARFGRGKYAMKSAAAIRDMWKDAARRGTQLHAEIETFYNGGPLPPSHTGFERVASFFRDAKQLIPWRTELQMASARFGLAGTADMLFVSQGKTTADGVTLVDWKRTDEISETSKYDSCRKELSHLPGAKFWKFALQLNLYAQLLWESCRIAVAEMLVVLLHPDGNTFKVLTVPVLPEAAAIYRRTPG